MILRAATAASALSLAVVLVAAMHPERADASLIDVLKGRVDLHELGEDAARAAAHAVPLSSVSGSTGFAFVFDSSSGLFRRDIVVAGELFAERADPLEVGRLNMSMLWQHIDFQSIDGVDFDDITSHGRPLPASGKVKGRPIDGIVLDALDLDLTVDQGVMSATYGLTANSDLSLTVSLVHADLSRNARVRFKLRGTENFVGPAASSDSGSSTGPGDTILRWKYRFLMLPSVHAALGFLLRAPSGDRDDFRGTGTVEGAPHLYVSTRPFSVFGVAHASGHVNLGVNFDADSLDRSQARYAAAVDVTTRWDLTIGTAVLGQSELSTPTDRHPPQLELPRHRRDVIDASFGLRFAVLGPGDESSVAWRPERVLLFANVLVPINDDGVRSNPIPFVGAEALF